MSHPSRIRIIAAFAAVYIVWGSTYLAIRIAVGSIPPFLMAGTRFLISGGLLYAWTRAQGTKPPLPVHWKPAFVVGGLLLFVGNGGVSWAEQFVASGVTALIIACSPLWFALLDWWHRGIRPTFDVFLGLALGTIGIVFLINPAELLGGEEIHIGGAGVLLVATISWAGGSLYSRTANLPSSQLLAAGMEMLAGGFLCVLAGVLGGELSDFSSNSITTNSLLSLGYLILFGSLVGFTSYVWLLKVVPPSLVSTYAYVNPVIAVFLGWLIADEPFGTNMLVAAGLIVGSVAVITTFHARRTTKSLKNLRVVPPDEQGSVVSIQKAPESR